MQDIFITGTSRGIGLELTRQYLMAGTRVFAAARSISQSLNDLRAQYDERLVIINLDVTDDEEVGAAFVAVSQHTDQLDVLINNAGVLYPSETILDVSINDLMISFAANAAAPFRVTQTFLPMLKSGSKIVNITMPTQPISKATPMKNHSYVVSRYAHNILTKMLALELEKQGLIVVAVYPGYIKTDMSGMAENAEDPTTALPKVVTLINSLTPEHNGLCLLPDGRIYEW